MLHRPFALQVAAAARELLALLDEAAAGRNDKLQLFADAERFPQVFEQVPKGFRQSLPCLGKEYSLIAASDAGRSHLTSKHMPRV